MLNKNRIKILLHDLREYLKTRKSVLCELNRQITNDTDHWIGHDYTHVLEYLTSYEKYYEMQSKELRKPRGTVLLILSYNEPFVLSVIPVLNALIAGNTVHVRSSSVAREFFQKVWFDSGIVEKHRLNLSTTEQDMKKIYSELGKYDDVYFFGGYNHALEMATECGKRYISFHPEVEGADTKVILPTQLTNWNPVSNAQQTIEESFSHAGQSCQRIHGVFIPNTLKAEYVQALQDTLNNSVVMKRHVRPDYIPSASQYALFETAITTAEPVEVYCSVKKLPTVIIDPKQTSDLVYDAYFLPTLWVIGYDELSDVLKQLQRRRFHLGLNLWGSDEKEINTCIEKTQFSRYTLNSSHITIRPGEGWGGVKPTGFSGYQSWIEHFSYPYQIIQ